MVDDIREIVTFRRKEIRRVIHDGEWWFVINDVIAALTGRADPADYLEKLRKRDVEFSKIFSGHRPAKEGGQIVPPTRLVVKTNGGRQKMNCWNTEGILRMLQSISSPKAEPFKRWLSRVGFEQIPEIKNPES